MKKPPAARTSSGERPPVEVPGVNVPEVQMSEIKIPEVIMSDVKMPDVEMPGVTVPNLKITNEQTAPVNKAADQMADQAAESVRSIREEVMVSGKQVVDQVQKMVSEGSVRRLILRTQDNRVVVEMPLVAGIMVGGVLTLAAPLLAVIGAVGSLLAQVKIEVVREVGPTIKM